MRLVLLHIQCPRIKNWKKGGMLPTTNKTLKVHLYHLIFHIKHSPGVHADKNIKDSIGTQLAHKK